MPVRALQSGGSFDRGTLTVIELLCLSCVGSVSLQSDAERGGAQDHCNIEIQKAGSIVDALFRRFRLEQRHARPVRLIVDQQCSHCLPKDSRKERLD